MIQNLVKKIKQEILKEATTDASGSRGSFNPPLKLGKRVFEKTQLDPFNESVSKYYSQELATDSYDGKMSTPKKDIKKIESKARKSSTSTNTKLMTKNVTKTPKNLNEWHYEEAPMLTEDINVWYNINEADSSISAGPYSGPQELGIRKWKHNNLSPFTEFVDTEVNHKKVKSTLKNNIKKVVGMWEKDGDGSYEIETGDVHTIKEDLGVWFGTKKKPKGSKQPKGPWVNICRKVDGKHPPCGRSESDTKGYPKCRATGVAGKMSDSEKKSACAQKRREEKKDPKVGTGNKPTMVSYKPKK
jgi:hypothetical protein